MKECKYCRTTYEDSLSVCPNCGGTKIITAQEKAEAAALYRKEIESRANAAAVVASKRKMLISLLASIGILIITVIVMFFYNINKPLSNGMTKDEGKAVLAEGIAFYNGRDYESAMECFVQLPSDSKQYDEAQSMLEKCENEYSVGIVEKANGYAENGEYDMAINLLNNAGNLLPNNTVISTAYDTIFAEYKEVVSAKALSEAETLAVNGDYPSAVVVIENVADIVGADEAQSMLEKCENEYSAGIVEKANGYAENGEYDMAINLLNNAGDLLPNNVVISTAYDTIFAEFKEVVCIKALSEAETLAVNGDYSSAVTVIDYATKLIGYDDELVAKREIYYDKYKVLAFQAIDETYDESGYESAINLIKSYQSFFSNDSSFNEKREYYETLKPISPFSLSTYKTSGTWGVTYYPNYEDALGKPHDDVYINSGTSLGLAPGAAWAYYYIESEYKTLTGEIAFESSSGSGYIQILSGDTVIYTSPSVNGIDGSIEFSVDVSGVDFLGIQVRSGESDWDCNSVMLIGLMLRK